MGALPEDERKLVPGRQTVTHAGLEFRVSADSWLRRMTHFPFYFESNNPSFRIDITRVSDPPKGEVWPDGQIMVEVLFADETMTGTSEPAPDLQTGESWKIVLRNVYTAHPGQTIIRIVTNPAPPAMSHYQTWKTIYSYQVRTEEQLWLGLFGVSLAVITAIGSTAPGWVKLLE